MKLEKDTFSRTVKEELSRVETIDYCEAFWEYYALSMLLFSETSPDERNQFPVHNRFNFESAKGQVKPYLLRRMFYLDKVINTGNEHPNDNRPKNLTELKYDVKARRAFLRGVFLAKGSLSSPLKQHHLEFVLPKKEMALLVSNLLRVDGLKTGIAQRRGLWIVYMKNGDEISEFLTMLGASRSVLKYEEIRVQKALKSSVQRQVNMDKANVSRTVESSLGQIADIELIDEEVGLRSLPPALKEVARARLANPSLTLEELGQTLNPPISKSAVNHRLRRISKRAASIKEGKPRGASDSPEGLPERR